MSNFRNALVTQQSPTATTLKDRLRQSQEFIDKFKKLQSPLGMDKYKNKKKGKNKESGSLPGATGAPLVKKGKTEEPEEVQSPAAGKKQPNNDDLIDVEAEFARPIYPHANSGSWAKYNPANGLSRNNMMPSPSNAMREYYTHNGAIGEPNNETMGLESLLGISLYQRFKIAMDRKGK